MRMILHAQLKESKILLPILKIITPPTATYYEKPKCNLAIAHTEPIKANRNFEISVWFFAIGQRNT